MFAKPADYLMRKRDLDSVCALCIQRLIFSALINCAAGFKWPFVRGKFEGYCHKKLAAGRIRGVALGEGYFNIASRSSQAKVAAYAGWPLMRGAA